MAGDGSNVYAPPDGLNVEKIDTRGVDYSPLLDESDLRDRQVASLGSPTVADAIAAVLNARPDDDSYGLVTRLAGSPASGPDPNNTTSVPLAADAEYVGDWTEVSQHGSLFAFFLTDQATKTPTGTYTRLEWSDDGVNPLAGNTTTLAQQIIAVTVPFPVTYHLALAVVQSTFFRGKYYRMKVTNGATPQTIMFALAGVGKYAGSGTIAPITDPLNQLSVAQLVRAVGAGTDPNGNFINVRAQGRHDGNSTTVPLNGDTGGTDHIFRGVWVEWQAAPYVGMVVDASSDVPGTLFIDMSEEAVPTDGDETSVRQSIEVDYLPDELLFRRTFPLQSRWVRLRYENDLAAQSEFQLDTAFLTTANVIPTSPMGVIPKWNDMAATGKALTLLESSDDPEVIVHPTATQVGDKASADVNVTQFEDSVPQRALKNLRTGQGTVTSAEAIPFPAVPLTDRATVIFANLDERISLYYSEDPDKLSDMANNNQGAVLFPLEKEPFDLDSGQTIYWRIEDRGGAVNNVNLNGSTTQANTGVLDPDDLLTSNDDWAVFDALTDTVEVTGFVSPEDGDDVGVVKLQLEGRKSSSPATETVAFVDVVTATAGNVNSITSPTVAFNPLHQYMVAISRRNASAVVTNVVGLGVGWVQIADQIGGSNESRVSLWIPTTQPSGGAGTVGALFSALATNAVIAVYRFSGVDLSAPVQANETLSGNNNNYSDANSGTILGMQAVFASMRERGHTPGGTFTERHETRTGSGTTDASLAMSTDPFIATASEAYSGTFSGNVGWSVIAIALKPVDTVDPIVRVRYRIGAGPVGATALMEALDNVADTAYEQDITGDRVWTFADINDLVLIVDVQAIGAAPAQVDRVGIFESDVESGNAARLSFSEVGGIL